MKAILLRSLRWFPGPKLLSTRFSIHAGIWILASLLVGSTLLRIRLLSLHLLVVLCVLSISLLIVLISYLRLWSGLLIGFISVVIVGLTTCVIPCQCCSLLLRSKVLINLLRVLLIASILLISVAAHLYRLGNLGHCDDRLWGFLVTW